MPLPRAQCLHLLVTFRVQTVQILPSMSSNYIKLQDVRFEVVLPVEYLANIYYFIKLQQQCMETDVYEEFPTIHHLSTILFVVFFIYMVRWLKLQ